ncbi:MAG: tRNA (adenosine(37)-N6)-threonylcarbamoyltransferase complex dimerization subunit type 1 TsaB [Proteobacteria bacterium]|nr:tRNA (adenosine(37)-N6)-threonylcarbamoyltransferase complex dimerization subunit type 1 TsaB [Pseudomonadota bacterium]
MKPTILAVDTAHGICSAALWREGAVAAFIHYAEPAKQAERLLPIIESMLEKEKLTYGALTHLVSTTGPGSFTGLRVGLAAISGIHIATGIPAAGLSTLQTLAWRGLHHEHIKTGMIASVIDAHRGQAYLQLFTNQQKFPVAASEPILVELADVATHLTAKDCTLFGNIAVLSGSTAATLELSEKNLPDATDAAEMAAALLARGETLAPALPLYIRGPDAKLPKKRI